MLKAIIIKGTLLHGGHKIYNVKNVTVKICCMIHSTLCELRNPNSLDT